MFPGLTQAAILTVIVILTQTTKRIQGDESKATDDHVINLTKETFDNALKTHKHLLVKFVAPWCGHCKSLVPAYAAAAKQLAESGSEVKMATVDATIEHELAQKHEVKGYPTIKFFSDGTTFEYTGGRTQDDLLNWLKKKTGSAAEQLKTVDDLKKFKGASDVVVIGAFKDLDGDAAIAFLQVAKSTDGTAFAITSADEIFKELELSKDTIVLLKKFDEGRNEMISTVDENTIREFIQANRLPLVIDFNAETAQKIFGGDIKVHVLLFSSKKHSDYEKIRKDFQSTAQKFRGRSLFVFIDADDEENERVLEFFGLKSSDIPTVRLITLRDEMTKFKPEKNEINGNVLNEFVQAFFDGKLKPHLLTQEIPDDWDKGAVKILVGKNFDQVAKDQKKTVLVSFVAPWCGHCKQMTPIYEKLAEKYKDNADVIIAKMDATVNELEDIKIQSFPTIKLFPKDSAEVIDFQGERTVEGLSKFIDSLGKEGARIQEETAEQTEDAEEEQENDAGHEDL